MKLKVVGRSRSWETNGRNAARPQHVRDQIQSKQVSFRLKLSSSYDINILPKNNLPMFNWPIVVIPRKKGHSPTPNLRAVCLSGPDGKTAKANLISLNTQ